MKLEELELLVAWLGEMPEEFGRHKVDGFALLRRLEREAKQQRRMQEPVKVAMTLNGCEYAAILNPESDEVEVRIAGIPAMSGEWRTVRSRKWVDGERWIDEEPEHPCIQRRDEYPDQPQPDDATLEVLSVALRHALVYR